MSHEKRTNLSRRTFVHRSGLLAGGMLLGARRQAAADETPAAVSGPLPASRSRANRREGDRDDSRHGALRIVSHDPPFRNCQNRQLCRRSGNHVHRHGAGLQAVRGRHWPGPREAPQGRLSGVEGFGGHGRGGREVPGRVASIAQDRLYRPGLLPQCGQPQCAQSHGRGRRLFLAHQTEAGGQVPLPWHLGPQQSRACMPSCSKPAKSTCS